MIATLSFALQTNPTSPLLLLNSGTNTLLFSNSLSVGLAGAGKLLGVETVLTASWLDT